MLSDQAAADNWNAWLDDLPIDAEFQPAIERLQDFISGLAAFTPARWSPPPEAERPWGLQCLGWIDDEWNHIIWTGDAWRWVSEGGEIVTPTDFAPLPPTLAQKGVGQ